MIDTTEFRRLTIATPQPIAVSLGRIARASSAQEQLDTIRRAAEVLTRYVAVAAISSITSTGDASGTFALPDGYESGKSLAWGYFLEQARRAAASPVLHPLQPVFVEGFGLKTGSSAAALNDLGDLLELRNQRSDHSLVPNSEAKAQIVLAQERASEKLLNALHAFRGLLSLPLVVIEGVRVESRRQIWRFMRFDGEPQPFPIEVEGRCEADQRVPYLALRHQLLALSPGLVLTVDEMTYQPTFAFLDRLNSDECGYRSLVGDRLAVLPVTDSLDPVSWLRGDPQPTDTFEPSSGRSLRQLLTDSPEETVVPRTSSDSRPDDDEDSAQVPPSESPAKRPRQRRTLEELSVLANDAGLGVQFKDMLEAAASAGLALVPYAHGVMIAPPSHRNRFLMWLKIVAASDPYLKVSIGPEAFAEFFPLSPEEVRASLGTDRRVLATDSVDDLVAGMANLFRSTGGAALEADH